jgi:hypothetical protein
MLPDLDELVVTYESQLDAVQNQFLSGLQSHVQQVCDQYGLEFFCGNGDWMFNLIPVTPHGEDLRRIGQLRLESNVTSYLFPDLYATLAYRVNGQEAGSLLKITQCAAGLPEFFGIEGSDECLDEPEELEIHLVSEGTPFAYGPLCLELAQALVELYNEDFNSGVELLKQLPWLGR